MRKLNFLSKSGRESRGLQSNDLGGRCRVVIDSLPSRCRVNLLKLLSVLVLVLTFGVGQVWADNVVYTFNTDAGISALGISKPASGAGTSLEGPYAISPVSMAVTHGSTATRVYNSSGTLDLRIYKSGGSLAFSVSDSYKITSIVIAGSAVNNFSYSGSDGTFTSGTWTAGENKSPTSVTLTASNTGKINTITVNYASAAASCSNKVTLSKGTATFNIDKSTGVALECCNALTVTVSNITIPSGKQFKAITQSGIAAANVTINNNAKTVTYAANSSGSSTIDVEFEDLPTYTVTLKDDESTLPQASAGASVTLPSRSCTGYTFAGWSTSNCGSSEITTPVPTIIPAGEYTPTANINLYPVYTRTDGTPESWDLVSAANDVTAGTYVITWDNSYYLPSETTAGSNPAVGSGITQENNKLTNTVTSAMQWTFTGDNTDGFAISHVSGNNTYRLVSSNTAQGITVQTTATQIVWKASVDATYGMLLRGSDGGTRNLAVYNSGSWRYYSTGGSYSGVLRLYKKSGGSVTYYISEPDCSAPSCEKIVNISAGAKPDHGSFALNKTGEQFTCNAAVDVIVTPTADEHYHVSAVSATTGETGVDNHDGTWTITYEQETNTASTINVTFTEDTKYAVTWNVNGNEDTKTNVYGGEKPVFPATPESCDGVGGSTSFIGWATAAWTGKAENLNGKTVYTKASDMPDVDAAVTYYAVFAKISGASGWVETTIGELTSSDVFVFVGDTYAMTNNNGTSSAPATSAVTIADGKITSEVADNLKWQVSGNATDGYSFSPNGSANYLYCNTNAASGSNNNMRIGTGGDYNRILFEFDEDGYLLTKDTYSDRYLSIYDNADFRGYANTDNNPIVPKFYKYYAGSASDYMTTCCTKYDISIADGIEHGSISADLAQACEGATVTMTFTPAGGYHLDSWSVNGDDQDVNANTFTMPAEDVEVSATFAHDPCSNLVAPTLNGAVVVTYNSAGINWNAAANASSYDVSVVRHSDSESIFSGNLNALTKALADLAPETQYDYSIMGVGDGTNYCTSGNGVLAGDFTTTALPSAHLTLIDPSGTHASSGDYAILTPFNLPTTAATCSKTFVGWDSDAECATAPTYAKGAEFTFENTTGVTLYAVYAKAGSVDVELNVGEYASANSWVSSTAYTDFTIDGVNFKTTSGGNNGKYYSSNNSWRFYSGGTLSITASANILSVSSTPSKTFTISGTTASYTGAAEFTKITVTVEGGYSNYSTTCLQQLAAPTFDVAEGTYYAAQTITLSATNEAAIYYSLDGSEPTIDAQHLYSEPFTLNERGTKTVKAIAVKSGFENSEVASAAYNINLPYDFAEFAELTKVNNKEYAVRGIISSKGALSSGKLTYTISADGSSTNQVTCYKGLKLNKADFESAGDVNLGDNVTVVGTWSTQFSNLNEGNWMLEYAARVHDSYEIVGDLAEIAFTNGQAFDDAILAGLSVNNVYTNGYREAVVGATFNCGDKTVWMEGETSLTVYAELAGTPLTSKNFGVTVSSATVASIELKADDEYYQTKVVYYIGDDFVEPKIVATLSDNTQIEATATYVSGYDKTQAGVQNVTVSYTRGETRTTSYSVTVNKVFDNEDAPHTVAKAIELIEASAYQSTTSSTDYMWVSGKAASTPNSSGTYTISDDGTATNALTIWNGKYFTTSTSAYNHVAAGDEVVLRGTIVNYNGNKAELTSSTVVYQLREGALTVGNVAEFEVGMADLAEADLTVNRNGSNGAITFSCESDALEVVEEGTKLRAKGDATADVEVTATMAATENSGAINFTEASTTFTVHVIPEQTRYTITFDLADGSASVTPTLDDQLEGANVEIPAGTYTKDGYKFNGWSVKETLSENPVAVTETAGVYSFSMPAADVTVTAQWVAGMDASWVAATWASAHSITSNTNFEGDYATIAVDANISLTWDKATGSNVPAYNSNNTEARLYQNTTLQVAGVEGKLIKKVTFTFRASNTGTISANVGSYSSGEWTGLANAITFTNTGSAAYIKSIAIEYINGTVTTLSIDDIALKLSDSETALSITKNVDATIIYEGLDESVATIADNKVTPVAVGSTTVTARIAQGANYTAAQTTFTITVAAKTIPVMSFPQAEYNANLGGSFTAPTLTKPEGVTVTYSSNNAAVSVDANTGAITINAEGTAVITATSVENEDYSVGTASYTLHVIDPNKDVLTAALIGKTSYAEWSDKTFGSGVKYAGYNTTGTGGNAGSIQMNANPSGIVSTSAIGYLKSLSATAHTGNAKTLEIYVKGSAYESSADLYSSDASVKGEKIGTIAAGGGEMVFETGKTYDDNYKFIGIKPVGGAVYYDNITITWTPAEFASYNVTYNAGVATGEDIVESIEEGSIISLKAADTFEAPEGKMFAGWLLAGEENAREAGSKFTVTAAATFTAQWVSIYTITYTAGEGTGEDVVVENVPVGDYELAANTFTAPDSKEFAGWKLNNEGETLAAGSNFNVTGDASFTAQWSIIQQPADLAYATTSYIITRGREFEAPELANPHGLAVTYSGNNDEVATVDPATGALTLKSVAGEVTVTATSEATDYYFAGEASYTLKVMDASLAGGWERLTSASTLVAGMKVIIAEYVSSGTAINAMGGQNTNNRAQVAGALEEGKLVANDGTEIFTLVKVGENTYAFKAADKKYLYAASSSQNYLKSRPEVGEDGNATWTISLTAGGKATITAQGNYTHNVMRYNKQSGLFSCYTGNQQDIALYSKTVAVSDDTDASTLEEYADVVVAEGSKLVVNEGTKPLGNITGSVEVNAPLQAEGVQLGVNDRMTVNSTVNVPSFSISVKLGSTGKATNVTVDGDNGSIAAPEGYVDMELSDGANPDHWHSFTVPFEVDALNGIYDAETGDKLKNEVNYAIMDYHGDIRANGNYGWKKYRGTLQPGTFYLITIDGESKVLRFMKKAGSSYVAGNSMEMTYYGGNGYSGASTDFGWCGVGNQNMFDGYVPSQYVAQVLNATGDGYEDIDNADALSACIPFFIQVNVTVNLVMNTSAPSQGLAPRRMPAKSVERMKVFFGNEKYIDKLYISASEEALNQYEIGKDLVKMTMTNTPNVAQIFGNAYGDKLCMVDAPMSNDKASYDLTLYAPEAGEYAISAPATADADIYLTKNGMIIWNLSMNECTLTLDKGNNEGFGLLLVKKAPEVSTGVETVSGEWLEVSGAQKVIIDEHVYILREGKMYGVDGKEVR